MDKDSSPPRKRPRPTFSCRECKRKKLKCDRFHPCFQCSKLSRGSECSYEEDKMSTTMSPSINRTEQSLQQQDLDDLRRRVADIERQLQSHHGSTTSTVIRPSLEDGIFRSHLSRKGSTTRFYSHLNWKSCGSEFPDVKEFLQSLGASKFHSLKEETLRLRSSPHKIYESVSYSQSTIETKMKSFLSNQGDCDVWTRRYTETFGKVFPMFDEQDLKQKGKNFWQDNHSSVQSDDTTMLKLFGLVSLGQSLDHSDTDSGRTVSSHHTMEERASLLRQWLSTRKGKKRLCLDILQLEVILALMDTVSMVRADELWLQTGSLVQLAMAVGLHHDPSKLGEFTDTESEERRATWFTVLEICFQNSMNCSMPFLTPKFSCNIPEDGTILARSFVLRCEIWNMLTETEAVLHNSALTEKLQQLLALPLSDPGLTNEQLSPSKTFVRHFQNGLLQRTTAYCHRQLAFGSEADTIAINAAEQLKILCLDLLLIQDVWDPQTSSLDSDKTFGYWDMHYCFFREDIIRSIMYLCLYIRSWKLSPLKFVAFSHQSGISNVSGVINNAIDALARRMQPENINKEIKTVISLSIIHACARLTTERGKSPAAEQALERAISKCRVRLSELADAQLRATLLLSTAATRTNTALGNVKSHVNYTVVPPLVADTSLYPSEFDSHFYNFQMNTDDWLFDL